MKQTSGTRRLTQLALLAALLLVMNFTPLGYLQVGPLSMSLMSIPVAIGAMLMGPVDGAILGSGCTIHLRAANIPYHPEALELADMGFLPAGAYRNREYVKVRAAAGISRAMQDLCYDPQTSGGLLFALPEHQAEACLARLEGAAIVGHVTEPDDVPLILE